MFAQIRERYAVSQEPLRSERRLELGLLLVLGVCILQALFVVWRYANPPAVQSVAPAADSLAVTSPAPVAGISAQQSFQFQARPLFWASRVPVDPLELIETVESEATAAAAPSALDGVVLTGLVVAPSGGSAIVQHKGKQMRLGVGEEVAGWEVLNITAEGVEFGSGANRISRTLRQLPVLVAAPQPPQAESESATEGRPTAGTNRQQRARMEARRQQQNQEREPERLSLGG